MVAFRTITKPYLNTRACSIQVKIPHLVSKHRASDKRHFQKINTTLVQVLNQTCYLNLSKGIKKKKKSTCSKNSQHSLGILTGDVNVTLFNFFSLIEFLKAFGVN